MIPHVECTCGLTMLPGAEIRGVERRWSCTCGASCWRSDQTPVDQTSTPAPPTPTQGAFFDG